MTIKIRIEAFGQVVEKEEDAQLAAAYIESFGVSMEDPQAALQFAYNSIVEPIMVRGQAHQHEQERAALKARFSAEAG